MKRITQLFFLFVLGMGLLAARHWVMLASADEPVEADTTLATGGWLVGVALTNASNTLFGAGAPRIAISADESRLMVAYVRQASASEDDTDIYYALSTTEGKFWSNPTSIHTSGGKATSVSLAFDSNNTAHAVWLEDGKIVYKVEGDWPNNSPSALTEISDTTTTSANIGPRIAIAANGTIDVVWGQPATQGSAPNIMHARLPANSNLWTTPKAIAVTIYESSAPAIAVDGNGVIHVAWQEQVFNQAVGFPGNVVNYARSTNGGANWSVVEEVSSEANLPTGWSALLPQIIVEDGQVEIFMTGFDKKTGITGRNNQGAFRTACGASNCASISNWGNGINLIPGAYVGVNDTTPSNMLIGASRPGACAQVVFHGTESGEEAERIWHSSGCSSSGRQAVTETSANIRYINPTLTQSRDWYLHAAYERIDSGNAGQIYYRRMEPNIFLPVVSK